MPVLPLAWRLVWEDQTHCAIQDAENWYPELTISSQSRIKIVADETL